MIRLYAIFSVSLAIALGCHEVGPTGGPRGTDDRDDTGQATDSSDFSDTETFSPVDVPDSCDELQANLEAGLTIRSTIGCEFYAIHLDNMHLDEGQFAVPDVGLGVANLHGTLEASVTLWQASSAEGWEKVRTYTVSPGRARRVDMPNDFHIESPDFDLEGSGLNPSGSFKLISDLPLVAFQGNPLSSTGDASTDFSSLIPKTSLGHSYLALGVGSAPIAVTTDTADVTRAYLAVIASEDNTTVTVTPSVPLKPEGQVSDGMTPFDVSLDEGDVLYLHNKIAGDSVAGTKVESDAAHPIAVFTGHECANIPADVRWCDHVEEQLPSVHTWGTHFVATRFPKRRMNHLLSDPVFWQIAAVEDNTTVTFTAPASVVFGTTTNFDPDEPEAATGGVVSPQSIQSVTLHQGETYEFYTQAGFTDEENFIIETRSSTGERIPDSLPIEPRPKPIGIIQGMTGAEWVKDDGSTYGDPALAYMVPTEQFMPRHGILIPPAWGEITIIITRPAGTEVLVNDEPVLNADFSPVIGGAFEVSHYVTPPSVYDFQTFNIESADGTTGIGVLVVGIDEENSFALPGSMAMTQL